MKKNEDIIIKAVSNGFIVEKYGYSSDMAILEKDIVVFDSINRLSDFVLSHFDVEKSLKEIYNDG